VSSPTERIVHAGLADGGAIARYDRAGKWYLEYPEGSGKKRRLLSLKEAVQLAVDNEHLEGAYIAKGRYGGLAFGAAVTRAQAARDLAQRQTKP
jgi:hypothetical protein